MALSYTPQPLLPTNPLIKPATQAGQNILQGIGNFASGAFNSIKNLATVAPTPSNNPGNGTIQYTAGGIPVLGSKTQNYTPSGQNYTPAPAVTNPSATAPHASSLGTPAAQEYMGNLAANQVNIGTTQNPNILTNGQSSVVASPYQPTQTNGGYSTIPGTYNPQTGQLNNPTPQPLTSSSTSSSNTQQIDPTTGQPIGANSTASQANSAFQTYLQSLQGDQKALASFNNQETGVQANLLSQPQLASVNTGQAYVQQQKALGEQQNLEQNVTNDQAGIQNVLGEQGIGVQQQQNANTLALGLKPTVASYGQTVFDPKTGTFSGGGNVQLSGQPATDTSNLATAVANGSIDYNTAFNQLSNAYGGAVANQLLSTIQKNDPSFNVNSSIGQGSAAQSNAAIIGGASTAANAQGYTIATQNYSNLLTAQNTATNLSSQVASALQDGGLNLTNSTDANAVISSLQSRLGNAAYTKLATAINDANSQYQSILASNGVTPTSAGGQAEQNLNINMTPNEIISALNQLNTGVASKVGPAYQQLQTFESQLNGGSANSNTSSGGWGSLGD